MFSQFLSQVSHSLYFTVEVFTVKVIAVKVITVEISDYAPHKPIYATTENRLFQFPNLHICFIFQTGILQFQIQFVFLVPAYLKFIRFG